MDTSFRIPFSSWHHFDKTKRNGGILFGLSWNSFQFLESLRWAICVCPHYSLEKLESLSLSPFPPSFLLNFLLIFYAIEVIFIFSNWLEEDKSSPYPFCILLVLVNRPVRSGKLLSRPEWFLAEWNRHYGNVAGQLWKCATNATDRHTHTHTRAKKKRRGEKNRVIAS